MEHFKRAKFIANLLDRQFNLGGIRFGLDPVLGLVPGIGDAIGLLLSLYIFYAAREINASKLDQFKIAVNIFLDYLIGLVPILGDIFDITYKANIRNIKILEKYSKGKFIDGQIVS